MLFKDLHCSQCGECCRKGGPLLHVQDLSMLAEHLRQKSPRLDFSKLITLRKGELAYDPVRQGLFALEQEVIKIAGTGESKYPWHCVLHINNGCSIHDLRPAQCQALYCQDVTALEQMYNQNRATRQDIFALSPKQDLWLELLKVHEEQCSMAKIANLQQNISQNSSQKLQEIIDFDRAFRDIIIERGVAEYAELNFILGRPLHMVLNIF